MTMLHPEKRKYACGGQVMTEAAIDAGLSRDLYVALGEPLGGGAWAVRVHVKPFVRWIWFGALLMALRWPAGGAGSPLSRQGEEPARVKRLRHDKEPLHEARELISVATGDFSGGRWCSVVAVVPGPGTSCRRR